MHIIQSFYTLTSLILSDRQMIYTIIISLLIEKPFYLLRPKGFSFQIRSEFIDTFVKFSNFMSQGWGIDSLFCPEGRGFAHNDYPGEGFCSLQVVPPGGRGWFWMKLIPALRWTHFSNMAHWIQFLPPSPNFSSLINVQTCCRIHCPNSTNPSSSPKFQQENQIKIMHGKYKYFYSYSQVNLLCTETI